MNKRALLLVASLCALGCHQPITMTIVPSSATVLSGDSFSFTATVQGGSSAVLWSVPEGAAGGSITSTGLYTAPSTTGIFHVVATSVDDPTVTATAEVTVLARANTGGVTITVAPASLTLPPGTTATLVAAVNGATNKAVSWQLDEGAAAGTLVPASDSGARYTSAGTGVFHITATAQADTTRSAKVTVTVQNGVVFVSLSPPTVTLGRNGTVGFTATVSGASNTDVDWVVDEGTQGGSVTALSGNTARYDAPGTPGTYHVTATSVADVSRSATATVTVSASQVDPPIEVFPRVISMTALARQTFSALMSGVSSTAVVAGVTYAVLEGAAGGSISSDGNYNAPASTGIFHITAQKGLQTAEAEVHVGGWGYSLAVNPGVASISPGATVQIQSQVYGTTQSAIYSYRVWGAGFVAVDGQYRAPSTPGVYAVQATAYLGTSWPAATALTTIEVK